VGRGGDLQAIVEAPKDNTYRVGVMANDHLTWLDAHAVDLGDGLIGWDATLDRAMIDDLLDTHGPFLVPAYQIGTVEVTGDTGVLRLLKPEWYEKELANDAKLRGMAPGAKPDWVIATGDEATLRALLRRAVKAEDALIDTTVYRVGARP
jgi:hypothetical protein